MENKDSYIFVDYEGTLCKLPKGSGQNEKVLLSDLLFKDIFLQLKPIEKVKKYLLNQNTKNIFVLGIVDTYQEIKQKEKWLKKHYSFIDENNYIFVSSEYKKIDVINEYIKNKHINKKYVIFIDDKQKHLELVKQEGIKSINVDEINNQE